MSDNNNGNIINLPDKKGRVKTAAPVVDTGKDFRDRLAELENTVENLTSALEKFGEANRLLTNATLLLDARIKTLEQKLGSGARMPAIIHPRSG